MVISGTHFQNISSDDPMSESLVVYRSFDYHVIMYRAGLEEDEASGEESQHRRGPRIKQVALAVTCVCVNGMCVCIRM